MRVVVKKWGNSASVRIPSAIMEAAHLHLDDTVEISEKNGRIIIQPLRQQYNLSKLLFEITEKNVHEAVDFGKAVGKEAF